MSSYGKEAEAARKPRKKTLEAISVKRSANGGFIARHSFDNSGPGAGYHDSEEHTFGEGEGSKLLSHIGQHMGISKAMKSGEVAD